MEELLDLSIMTSLRIGVYYLTGEWKEHIYNSVLYTVTSDSVLEKTEDRICLKTGTTIYFFKADSRMKGVRVHRVILEEGIDENIYNIIIQPMMITNRFSSMVYFSDNHFNTVDNYYFEINNSLEKHKDDIWIMKFPDNSDTNNDSNKGE